jgi:MFS transporter, OPA family, sugar phosphate sensor protein UhpC
MSALTPEGRKVRRGVFGLTWTSYAIYYFARRPFPVAKATISSALGVTTAGLALIDTLYLAAYAAGQFGGGWLGDRIGARRLIGWGMIGSAAALALFGASSSTFAFAVLFLLNGLFQATGWPGNIKAMAAWFGEKERGAVMGFWTTCFQVGPLVATGIAVWLRDRYGWRWAFFGPAALVGLVGVAVLLLLHETPRPGDLADAEGAEGDRTRGPPELSTARATSQATSDPNGATPSSAKGGAAHPGAKGDVARRGAKGDAAHPGDLAASRGLVRAARTLALKNPVVWLLGLSYFGLKLVRYCIDFWQPFYLEKGLHYASGVAGYASTAFQFGGIFGAILVGAVSDRWFSHRRGAVAMVMTVGLALSLALYSVVAPYGLWANVAAMALVGFCLFGPDALISGVAAQDLGGPLAAATIAGFINGCGSVGAIAQGWLVAGVSTKWGWQAVFEVLMVLAALSSLALAAVWRLQHRNGEQQAR